MWVSPFGSNARAMLASGSEQPQEFS